jgi:hypothetical protein
MMPLSYQGFGFTAILVMVAILSAGQLIKYLRDRFQHPERSTVPKHTHRDSVKK